jgi:hypothetical protein
MQNIIYKVTIEKGWNPCDQRVFKTFYFEDITVVNDFVYRLTRKQNQIDCNIGKIQMEQLLNCDKKLSTNTYREYAKLVLDMGMQGNANEYGMNPFKKMIERIILENSTPVIYKKFKRDVKTRIWFSDVKERNYPRSAVFLDKEQKQKILESV